MYDPNIRIGHVLESEKFFIIMLARSKPQMGEFILLYQHRFWHLLIFSTDSKLCYLYATKAKVFFFFQRHIVKIDVDCIKTLLSISQHLCAIL